MRYSGEAEPAFAGVCHCRDCQKFTGSAFGAMVGVPQTSVKFEGTRKTFTSLGGSGKPISRHFCPECGSSISEETVNLPGHVVINVGTFDDPAQMTPMMEIFCDDALSRSAWRQSATFPLNCLAESLLRLSAQGGLWGDGRGAEGASSSGVTAAAEGTFSGFVVLAAMKRSSPTPPRARISSDPGPAPVAVEAT